MNEKQTAGSRRIGVLGHYGNGNLGDEAITTAVIQNIQSYFANATVIGFSINPIDTHLRYGIAAYPIRCTNHRPAAHRSPEESVMGTSHPASVEPRAPARGVKTVIKRIPAIMEIIGYVRAIFSAARAAPAELGFLCKSYRIVRTLDLLIIAGSNQFLDNFGGPWGFPYTLLKWTLLARTARVPTAYMSVGAGPLDGLLSKLFVRLALKLSDYRSYRDFGSKQLIRALGYTGEDCVAPDLAHSLLIRATPAAPAGPGKLIGINPMPVYHHLYWPIVDSEHYQKYVAALASFTERLIAASHKVRFFSTQPMDRHVVQDVCDVLRRRAPGGFYAARYPQQVTELTDLLQEMDIVVATRFHGVLLALSLGKPAVAIAYYRKTRELMEDMEQGDYVVDLESLCATDLELRTSRLCERIETEQELIKGHAARYRAALAAQYQAVFALMKRV